MSEVERSGLQVTFPLTSLLPELIDEILSHASHSSQTCLTLCSKLFSDHPKLSKGSWASFTRAICEEGHANLVGFALSFWSESAPGFDFQPEDFAISVRFGHIDVVLEYIRRSRAGDKSENHLARMLSLATVEAAKIKVGSDSYPLLEALQSELGEEAFPMRSCLVGFMASNNSYRLHRHLMLDLVRKDAAPFELLHQAASTVNISTLIWFEENTKSFKLEDRDEVLLKLAARSKRVDTLAGYHALSGRSVSTEVVKSAITGDSVPSYIYASGQLPPGPGQTKTHFLLAIQEGALSIITHLIKEEHLRFEQCTDLDFQMYQPDFPESDRARARGFFKALLDLGYPPSWALKKVGWWADVKTLEDLNRSGLPITKNVDLLDQVASSSWAPDTEARVKFLMGIGCPLTDGFFAQMDPLVYSGHRDSFLTFLLNSHCPLDDTTFTFDSTFNLAQFQRLLKLGVPITSLEPFKRALFSDTSLEVIRAVGEESKGKGSIEDSWVFDRVANYTDSVEILQERLSILHRWLPSGLPATLYFRLPFMDPLSPGCVMKAVTWLKSIHVKLPIEAQLGWEDLIVLMPAHKLPLGYTSDEVQLYFNWLADEGFGYYDASDEMKLFDLLVDAAGSKLSQDPHNLPLHFELLKFMQKNGLKLTRRMQKMIESS